MTDPVEVARQHARRLHRRAQALEPSAITFARRHPELRTLRPEELAQTVRRRHALSCLAMSLGCRGWPHLKAVLESTPIADKGRLLYRESAGYWHVWSASYEEAAAIRAEHGGFLLPFKSQFFVAEAPYVAWMGGQPDAVEWDRIGRDWVKPAKGSAQAWRRLTSRIVDARVAQVLAA